MKEIFIMENTLHIWVQLWTWQISWRLKDYLKPVNMCQNTSWILTCGSSKTRIVEIQYKKELKELFGSLLSFYNWKVWQGMFG